MHRELELEVREVYHLRILLNNLLTLQILVSLLWHLIHQLNLLREELADKVERLVEMVAATPRLAEMAAATATDRYCS